MEDFGKRLKEERERLGLSQAKFAEACNIGKTAQYTYERGDRVPSLEYVDSASKLGVDVQYLLRGVKTGVSEARAYGFFNLLYKIEKLLGLKEGEIENLNQKILDDIDKGLWLYSLQLERPNSSVDDDVDVKKWLATSTTPDRCLDLDLFTNVLTEIEGTLERNKTILSPAKKSAAVVMLYRAFKASGRLDQAMIDDAVKLASS